jgi:hypothetical protein
MSFGCNRLQDIFGLRNTAFGAVLPISATSQQNLEWEIESFPRRHASIDGPFFL